MPDHSPGVNAAAGGGAWVEDWLSGPRFARYLAEADGARDRALELYEWNLKLGAALMRDIAHVEVAIRNAYDRTMQQRWRGTSHWLLDPTSPVRAPLWRTVRGRRIDLNTRNRASIAEAVVRCGGASAKPDAVIAELSFGFWRHCTDPAHEKTLWVPYLHQAWPKKTDRPVLDRALATINTARNRASHHEPLFGSRLAVILLPRIARYCICSTCCCPSWPPTSAPPQPFPPSSPRGPDLGQHHELRVFAHTVPR